MVRNVNAKRVQADEIWSFIAAKQKNVTEELREKNAAAGDVWTWTAIDADTKLVIAYLVGARDGFCAELLMRDLESRIVADETQLTTDQLSVYLKAVDHAFKGSIDYAMLHTVDKGVHDGRYSPAECIGTTKVRSRATRTRSTSPRPTWSAPT
jgi:IS1 family transposase